MVAEILIHAGFDPTVILGGALPSIGRSGRAGLGLPFLVEADEYDHMFLGLHPRIAVITNIEHDHPDLFPTSDEYQAAFQQFASLVPLKGTLIVCMDDPGVRRLVQRAPTGINVVGYGLAKGEGAGSGGQWISAVEMRPNRLGGFDFLVTRDSETVGLLRLRVPGHHNVRNALAAVAVAMTMDVPFSATREALAAFGGISRRFQTVGEVGDVIVIDDYAHHPTEIQATLAAARQQFPGRRIWAVWQPHTFSRTQLLMAEFASAFVDADRVIALDIYRSREPFTKDINTSAVVARMVHPYARHIGGREEASSYILDRVRPGDVILTLGAGDSDEVGRWILEGLQDTKASRSR
jgi:UDP-N-acetylmuramate--alanine ligase